MWLLAVQGSSNCSVLAGLPFQVELYMKLVKQRNEISLETGFTPHSIASNKVLLSLARIRSVAPFFVSVCVCVCMCARACGHEYIHDCVLT